MTLLLLEILSFVHLKRNSVRLRTFVSGDLPTVLLNDAA
jgi:hypothetical protein